MANKMELSRINRNIIYRCIYESDGISRQEAALKTGLSMPTVLQNLNSLEEKGLIAADGVFESTGGRRAKVIRCVEDAAYAVGIDVTKNHLTIVVINLKGKICCGGVREDFPYDNTDGFYERVAEKLERLLAQNGIDRERILGVGVSLPSIVDRKHNYVTYGTILGEPAEIHERFSESLPYRVELFNDANSGGYAETWHGDISRTQFYLMLSNSVGGATINQNQIYLGDHCRSSEIGHVKLVPNGKPCYCGQKGCVNAYISARILSDQTQGNLEVFFRKIQEGDPACAQIFSEYLDALAITVANIRMLYDCDIILGGYVGKYIDNYMDALGERLALLNPYETDSSYVRPCRYKIEASAVGAALPFISSYIESI